MVFHNCVINRFVSSMSPTLVPSSDLFADILCLTLEHSIDNFACRNPFLLAQSMILNATNKTWANYHRQYKSTTWIFTLCMESKCIDFYIWCGITSIVLHNPTGQCKTNTGDWTHNAAQGNRYTQTRPPPMEICLRNYWPFVRGIHRSPVDSPKNGPIMLVLVMSFFIIWKNC